MKFDTPKMQEVVAVGAGLAVWTYAVSDNRLVRDIAVGALPMLLGVMVTTAVRKERGGN